MSSRTARILVALCTLGAPLLDSPAALAVPGLRFEPYQSFSVGSMPQSVTMGDFNSDGRQDVAMSTTFYFDSSNDYKIFVFLQRADGTLGSPSRLTSAIDDFSAENEAGLASDDLNGDGKDDIARATGAGVEIFHQAAMGFQPRFLVPTEERIQQLVTVDIEEDGDRDLVALGNKHVLLIRRASGKWTVSEVAPRQREIEVGDITGDGRVDIVGITTYHVNIYPQQVDGSFGLPLSFQGTDSVRGLSGLEVADVSGDGFLDAAVSYGGNEPTPRMKIFHGLPGGILIGPIEYASWDIPQPVEAMDMNGDGREDVVTAHGGWLQLGVYIQQDTGLLGAERLWEIPYASHYRRKGMAVGDVTGDGRPDVVIADTNHGLVVLRQTG